MECISDVVTEESCTADTIGKLFLKSEAITICLNYDDTILDETKRATAVELTVGNNGNYLISKNANPNINVFGITGTNDKYAIINIKGKIVTLVSDYSNDLKYVYGIKSTSKVMEKKDKTCPIKTGSSSNEIDKDAILELSCTRGRCKNAGGDLILTTGANTDISGKFIIKKNPISI